MCAWTPRAHGARAGRVRVFFGGALRCLAGRERPSQTKQKAKRAREEHTAGPCVHTPAYCYDPDDPNFGFDECDDQTCLGGGDWGDFVDDSGG